MRVPDMYAGDQGAIDNFLGEVRRGFQRTGQIDISSICLLAELGHAEEVLTLALTMTDSALAEAAFGPYGNVFNTAQLFGRFQPAIRRDRRFVEVCARFGLADYWLATDIWPDCVEEVAPYYDFKAECRRAAEGAPASG
jgi:hypothetical protein